MQTSSLQPAYYFPKMAYTAQPTLSEFPISRPDGTYLLCREEDEPAEAA
jgi:hypothetical protein